MSAVLAVLAALGEATCAAVAGTLQHTTARRGRIGAWTPTGQIAQFARHQLGQPLWWTSFAVQAGSVVMHATALHLGSLALVQPVLAVVVVLALPLNQRVRGMRITRAELGWAALVTAGLAGFLAIIGPGSSATPLTLSQLAVPGALAAVAVGICVAIARWAPAQVASVALGTAAGIAFSLEAAVLQNVTTPLLRHPLAELATAGPYALVLAGGCGVTLTQLSYRAGRMSSALPAIVTVNPLASVLIGSLVGRQGIPLSPGALAGEIPVLACLLVAVGALARTSGRDPADRSPGP